jgi:hypothetical protein
MQKHPPHPNGALGLHSEASVGARALGGSCVSYFVNALDLALVLAQWGVCQN